VELPRLHSTSLHRPADPIFAPGAASCTSAAWRAARSHLASQRFQAAAVSCSCTLSSSGCFWRGGGRQHDTACRHAHSRVPSRPLACSPARRCARCRRRGCTRLGACLLSCTQQSEPLRRDEAVCEPSLRLSRVESLAAAPPSRGRHAAAPEAAPVRPSGASGRRAADAGRAASSIHSAEALAPLTPRESQAGRRRARRHACPIATWSC
jgi:hypothetical protein